MKVSAVYRMLKRLPHTASTSAKLDLYDSSSDKIAAILASAAISSFIQRIGFPADGLIPDAGGVLERCLREEVNTWDVGNLSLTAMEPCLICTVDFISSCYSHLHPDCQLHIASHCLLAYLIEDMFVPVDALTDYMPRLYSGSPQLHPILDRLVDNLRGMHIYYAPLAVGRIVRSTIDFVGNIVLDHSIGCVELQPSALSFTIRRRLDSAAGEAYASFIWDKANFPDFAVYVQALHEINEFIAYGNDVLSFYKEELAHETSNYVHERAVVTQKGVMAALLDIADDAANACQTVRMLLKDEKARAIWDRYTTQYVAFHMYTPRYKLMDILTVGNC